MPAAALQNLGLMHGWILGEEPWGDQMNANLRALDGLVQLRILDKDLTAPPGAPIPGDIYIVGAAPTGLWAGHTNKIARYSGTVWEFFPPSSGWIGYVVDETIHYKFTTVWTPLIVIAATYYEKQVACSDYNLSELEVGEVMGWRSTRAFTLSGVRISLQTAQTSGALFTVDIKKNGVTMLSTLLTIDNGELTSVTAATPAVISVTAIADDDRISIHVTQIGNSTAIGLIATLIGSY